MRQYASQIFEDSREYKISPLYESRESPAYSSIEWLSIEDARYYAALVDFRIYTYTEVLTSAEILAQNYST